jgi:chromosome condensin MukBEF ATPase and DNA-binding subunit MukB
MEETPPKRPRLDARVTAYLIEQREKLRALELGQARLEGELAASERNERAAQRYADKLEEKLAEARRREASLARALGYVEAERDRLAARLREGTGPKAPELAEVEFRPQRRTPPAARKA